MGNAKQFLFDMLVDEFNIAPSFLLARTIFLFCHFNPALEMPHDILLRFIHGLMEDEVRAFSLIYPQQDKNHDKPSPGSSSETINENKQEIYNEIAAEYLSEGTGKTYTPTMVKDITTKFKSIMSYNEILETFMMATAQKRVASWELSEFTDMLRSFPVFSSLSENELYDLFNLLRFKRYNQDEFILKKGDPGTHLYIVLTGKAEVVGDNDESIAILESGGIFGEMSLLTGAPVGTSVYSRGVTKLAALTSKDFKNVLHKYPVLHAFFYKLLIERAGAATKKLDTDINAGMTGDISEINIVELLQMINASQKTGTVHLKLTNGRGKVYFNEGEVVYADYEELKNRRAIFALLGVSSGQFLYTPGIPPEAKEFEIIGGFMGLVMEGMQRLDEEADILEKAI